MRLLAPGPHPSPGTPIRVASQAFQHTPNPQPTQTSSYLAHLCDGVVKHTPRVVGPLPHQLHLPGPGGQAQVRGIELHHLPGDLHKDGLALAPPAGGKRQRRGQAVIWKSQQMENKKGI